MSEFPERRSSPAEGFTKTPAGWTGTPAPAKPLLSGARRRGGRPLPCFGPGAEFPLRARAQVHALRCQQARAVCAARPPGLCPAT